MSAALEILQDGIAAIASIAGIAYALAVVTSALTGIFARSPKRRDDAKAVLGILLKRDDEQ